MVALFRSAILLALDLVVTANPWPSKNITLGNFRPPTSRLWVQVKRWVSTSTAPVGRPAKAVFRSIGTSWILLSSSSTAAAMALHRSTSKPVRLPALSSAEKPGAASVTPHLSTPWAFTSSRTSARAGAVRAAAAARPSRVLLAVERVLGVLMRVSGLLWEGPHSSGPGASLARGARAVPPAGDSVSPPRPVPGVVRVVGSGRGVPVQPGRVVDEDGLYRAISYPVVQRRQQRRVIGLGLMIGAGPIAAPKQRVQTQFAQPQPCQRAGVAAAEPVGSTQLHMDRSFVRPPDQRLDGRVGSRHRIGPSHVIDHQGQTSGQLRQRCG